MEPTNVNQEEKGEDLFHYLAFRFVPYWPMFAILILISGGLAWLYIKKTMPTYSSSATIMLKDERKGVDEAQVLEALNVYTSNKIVENEVEVIRSRSLMKQVVERLHLYAPVYREGTLRDENMYSYSPVVIIAKNPSKIPYAEKVPFTYDRASETVNIGGQSYEVNMWHNTPYGELKFSFDTTNNYDSDRALYFKLINSTSFSSRMAGNLTIEPANKTSTVLYLTLEDESPERAKDVLNELVTDYARSTINEKNALAANTLDFIEDRLNYLVQEIDSIEHSIQSYKSNEGIVNLSDQGRLFLNNVGDNDRRIGSINMQLAVLDQVEKYVVSKNSRGGLVPSTLGLGDEVLSKLVQRLYDAELLHERLRKTMAENDPSVVAVANEIETIRPAILENVRNQKASLLASKEGITQTNGQYSSMIRKIPAKERKLVEISREQSIKNGVYSYLLQRREEAALSSSTAVADSRLIDPAVSSWRIVSPINKFVYITAIVIALLVGTVIVIAFELLPGKILFRSDIEKYTRLPIVGEIASLKKKSDLVVTTHGKAFIAEQFRHLRAAMGLYGRKLSKQSILITSSIPGEGKSFIASNLALSLSLSGKKVVLIDADFRSPKTTSTFNLRGRTGFVDYLNNEAGFEDIISTTDHPNLFIVPAGSFTHNPTELLLNGKLNSLFSFLLHEFDFVLVDTSPVAPVTDAYVLSDYCDKTLFVIRHGFTPKAVVKIIDENIKLKALKNINLVFNGVKKRGFAKGGYGFGYGFGYEYVYEDRLAGGKLKS